MRWVQKILLEGPYGRSDTCLAMLLMMPITKQANLFSLMHLPILRNFKSIRGIANTMIGISYYLRSNPSDDSMTERLRNLSYKLVTHYDENSTPDWKWFESLLAYDNGMLPLALLHSAEILNDE